MNALSLSAFMLIIDEDPAGGIGGGVRGESTGFFGV
jgi:hypothetical protein